MQGVLSLGEGSFPWEDGGVWSWLEGGLQGEAGRGQMEPGGRRAGPTQGLVQAPFYSKCLTFCHPLFT